MSKANGFVDGASPRLVWIDHAGEEQAMPAAALQNDLRAAKTAAQRQAERKARELAAGRVQWKRWVHPDDVPALTEYAEKLARKRARSERAAVKP
jgi:hypothetical protein